MALRKKSDGSSKRVLKEKVVQIYERFFHVSRREKFSLRYALIFFLRGIAITIFVPGRGCVTR